jgi:hypothetical protein
VQGKPPRALAAEDFAGEYFAELRGRFELAADAAGGAVVDDLEMAGLRLRIIWGGKAMREALLPPFKHLVTVQAAAPELFISVFDAASTGVEAPRSPWAPLDAAPGTNPVARLRSDRACVLAAAGTGAITAAEPGKGRAIFYLPDADRIPASERAAPLREALQLLMAPRGRWMTHAGAVGRQGRGILLAGPGGSGKSTLALSCALAGMEIVADDYVLLEAGPPLAHAMQSTAKLTEESGRRLGIGGESVDPAGFEPTLEGPAKALVEIPAIAPGTMRRRLAIVAVVAPVLPGPASAPVGQMSTDGELDAGGGQEEASMQPVAAARGLRAIAPSTIVQSGFQGASSLTALADLVRQVPSYVLELSSDPAANVGAVDRLVDELG